MRIVPGVCLRVCFPQFHEINNLNEYISVYISEQSKVFILPHSYTVRIRSPMKPWMIGEMFETY